LWLSQVLIFFYKIYIFIYSCGNFVTGPGNNGGDAMVAVRHLKLFGFENVTLLNTRQPSKELLVNLVHQAQACGVTISYEPQQFL
jgi:NAD(P)H-hydrate repair Nnr-like enzyme with NAD(P)H-hydrate epimerase domain